MPNTQLSVNDELNSSLISEFEELSPSEQRARLLIIPEYADEREEYIRPDKIVAQFRYFWDYWVPKLGPLPSMLYMKLRQFGYYNHKTKEQREALIKFPKQADLAESLGVKKRHTIGTAMKTLEKHGLIRREKRYRYDPALRKKIRTADAFWVQITDILIPEHQVEMLLKHTTGVSAKPPGTSQDSPKAENGPKVLSEPRSKAENRPTSLLAEKRPAYSVRSDTNNVVNVRQKASKQKRSGHSDLFANPKVQALTAENRAKKELLAGEIGRVIKKLDGQRNDDAHPWAGFHFRIACLMPRREVDSALIATHDAVSMGRTNSASKYFTGIIKNKAKDLGVDLGLKQAQRPLRRPK